MIAEYLDEVKANSPREWIKHPTKIDPHCEPGPSQLRNWQKWIVRKRTFRLLPREPQQSARIDPAAERIFRTLEERWKGETSHLSSITDIVLNQHYQNIIGLGPAVVPLLLRRLEQRPEHWFWALQSITRTNPVRDDESGDMEQMSRAWVRWGRSTGLI